MEINRRALYNSLRMNWVLDPTLKVEAWQVEDHRAIPTDQLFERLEDMDIRLDKSYFTAFADSADNPEDLTENMLHDSSDDLAMQDQVYLIVFELWRRLLPERPCLSILCDEIDHQIHLYDQNQANNEEIVDALANLQVILDENADEGADPHEVFECINSGCANDIESFLHDFISEKIDDANYSYASELLEGFGSYLKDAKWFEFLRARLVAVNDPDEANRIVKELMNMKEAEADLDFNFEILSFLAVIGERDTFERLVKQSAKLLENEEDFQTLIAISAEFFHRLDREMIEKSLQAFLKQREKFNPNQLFSYKNADWDLFFNIISRR